MAVTSPSPRRKRTNCRPPWQLAFGCSIGYGAALTGVAFAGGSHWAITGLLVLALTAWHSAFGTRHPLLESVQLVMSKQSQGIDLRKSRPNGPATMAHDPSDEPSLIEAADDERVLE